MKLWMGGEVQADVTDLHRVARKEVQDSVNRVIGAKEYGGGVGEWAYLAIILNGEIGAQYPEVSKYKKRVRECEFRLKIDHGAFKEATDLVRRQLLLGSLVRSVELMAGLGIEDFDVAELKRDMVALGNEQHWLER